MSLFKSIKPVSVERPSLKINLRVVNKHGLPADEQDVWQALIDAFKDHPYLDVYQAEVRPDTDEN